MYNPARHDTKGLHRPQIAWLALDLLVSAVILVAALTPFSHAGAAGCHTIFKAGLGYVDSCTLQQRSPYADLPTKTPTPASVLVVEREVVYIPAPTATPTKSKIPVPYPYVAPPAENCGYLVNVLGRCPVPGDKWVYDNDTGKVYPGTSVVPPYSDQAVLP